MAAGGGGGLSLWGLSLAAVGGVLIWAGIYDPPGGVLQVVRDVSAGRRPTPGVQRRRPAPVSGVWSEPGAPGNAGSAVATEALKYKGVPYKLGGTTSAGIDCSGLVLVAYRDAPGAGIKLPHSATQQCYAGRAVSRKEVTAGDIVGWPGGGHSGVALDSKNLIMAQQPGLPAAIFPIDATNLAVGGKVFRRLV